MDTPNKDVEDADHGLHFLTSDETMAGTYLSHSDAPAQSYNACSDPLQTLHQASQPDQESFAPTNVSTSIFQAFAQPTILCPFPRSFAQTNAPNPSPPQAQTQHKARQSRQDSLVEPYKPYNFIRLSDAYTHQLPLQAGGVEQFYHQPVHVGQFSPTHQPHNTVQPLQPSQTPQGCQGYVLPRTGESQPGPFHGTFNGPSSNYQKLSPPQPRASPTPAVHNSNVTCVTTGSIWTGFDGDPLPQTRAYLASTGYRFNRPNSTNFFVGSYAPASQSQSSPANIAIQDRQPLMSTHLMPPPKSTQPLPRSKPDTQPTQHPPMQLWCTDNLQRK
jgi:hypothetical protein